MVPLKIIANHNAENSGSGNSPSEGEIVVIFCSILLVVCQLNHDVIGYEDCKCEWLVSIRLLGFCTLCFYFSTKMLPFDVPFFQLKCSVAPQKVMKHARIMHVSKILAVYYQCCVLIGWATTRLYSPLVAKSAGFENQNNGGWIAFC